MNVVKRTSKAWLPLVALLLIVLTSLLLLTGAQAVTKANALPQDLSLDKLSSSPSTASMDARQASQTALALDKTAWPTEIINGDLVTYTVTVSNTGQMTGTMDAVIDTLDPGLTFAGMLAGSDIITPPQEISNTLTWTGPFTLSAGTSMTLLYQAQTPAVDAWTQFCNSVEISTTETAPPAAEACVDVRPEFFSVYLPHMTRNFEFARLEVAKSVSPAAFTVTNVGDTTGSLVTVSDTLPGGFTFLGMEPGSDVATNPVGTSGTITWDGNWAMSPGSQLNLVYRVRPSEVPGQYPNSVTVVAQNAYTPQAPAVATVVVEPNVLLQENFDDPAVGINRWTPFLNYWRLLPGQWSWQPADGVGNSGAATQDCWLGGQTIAEDALLMYLDEEAAGWTDYRVETKLLLRGGVTEQDGEHIVTEWAGFPVGLWVRGQYQDVGESDPGGWVTGYYAMVGGKPENDTMFVRLLQIQTTNDCWGDACGNPGNLYDFNNPHALKEEILQSTFQRHRWYTLAVEVRGPNIKIYWEGDLVLDHTDTKEVFMEGTIGFKTFKSKTVSFDDVVVTPLSD